MGQDLCKKFPTPYQKPIVDANLSKEFVLAS
jgi:hypothetical protein